VTDDENLFGEEHVRRYVETDGEVGYLWREGATILILTTTGAKTGQPRTSVVTYTRDGDAYVVAASKNGMPTNPAWFANLVANPTVTIETEGKTTEAKAEVALGSDRDELWDRHVLAYPAFADYPPMTGGRVTGEEAGGRRPALAAVPAADSAAAAGTMGAWHVA